jgi:hypothetical protein
MLRWSLAVLACACLTIAAGTWITDGFVWIVGPLRLSSRSALRPLAIALVCGGGYLALAGRAHLRRDATHVSQALSPQRLAAVLAIASAALALGWNAWTAGGADAYAYVTQADLWLQGSRLVTVPIADQAPWPNALASFTPYGYRSSPEGHGIVPVTAPGLPLLMAAFKWAGGHCAGFWVVPLSGGLLILATYAIGRRAGTRATGLGAAWLVATSPTFLAMTKSTMSDVPAAAFWAAATALVLAPAPRAVGAGLAASAAILVRPNLVALAVVLASWLAWRAPGWRAAARFALAAAPGCLAVAAVNTTLYGSPLASGYGDLGSLFAWSHVPANVVRFASWLTSTQTVAAVAGLATLAVPSWRLWPTPAARQACLLLAGIALVVWGAYVAYTPFDAWWFLRFLLPAWPPLAVGTVVLVTAVCARLGRGAAACTCVVLAALGLYGAAAAWRLGVYPPGEGERRYATIAQLVRQATDPDGVVITGQHVGATRYYGGRLTLRFDQLDPDWLDRAAHWLTQRGRHVYILLEDWERPLFEQRFAARNALGRLTLAPVLAYRAHRIDGTAFLYDPSRPDGPTLRPPPIPDPRPRCLQPSPAPPMDAAPGPSGRAGS